MAFLFEYGDWVTTPRPDDLRKFLREIYDAELFTEPTEEINEENSGDLRFQPFLQFDGNQIRAKNFVGFIQNDDEVIEIYPKVFRGLPDASSKKAIMLRHLFYWFGYCRKWKFPFTQASLETRHIDNFPELIIHLMARQMLETVSSQPLSIYEPVEEALRTPRGSINFKRYIANGFATGNLHIVDCDHKPFSFNNRINRIIKHCARLLLTQTRLAENVRLLQETIFVLDEVDDVLCTIHDVESSSLNPFFADYVLVMDVCRVILSQQLYSSHLNDLSQWCLLFPMEYIFEDFVAGFLESHFGKEWKVEYQKSDMYLSDEPRAFRMQHDIFLTHRESRRRILVDTKYKLRTKLDDKEGISQADMYQMTSYAFKRGCNDVLLLYPNTIDEVGNEVDRFKVQSGFSEKDEVEIRAAEMPFWSMENFPEIGPNLTARLGGLLAFDA